MAQDKIMPDTLTDEAMSAYDTAPDTLTDEQINGVGVKLIASQPEVSKQEQPGIDTTTEFKDPFPKSKLEIASRRIKEAAMEEVGMVPITQGMTGNNYTDFAQLIENASANLFALPMYPLKKIMQAESGMESIVKFAFGTLKPGDFEAMDKRNQELLGKSMNALGYVSGVMADLVNKPDTEIFKTIGDNWKTGRTLGDSIKDGLTLNGASKNEVDSMMGRLFKMGVDLTTTIFTIKGTVGTAGKIIADVNTGKALTARAKINELAREADLQDAIDSVIADKTNDIKIASGATETVADLRKSIEQDAGWKDMGNGIQKRTYGQKEKSPTIINNPRQLVSANEGGGYSNEIRLLFSNKENKTKIDRVAFEQEMQSKFPDYKISISGRKSSFRPDWQEDIRLSFTDKKTGANVQPPKDWQQRIGTKPYLLTEGKEPLPTKAPAGNVKPGAELLPEQEKYLNLWDINEAFDIAEKDVYTGDAKVGITKEMRDNFAKGVNAFPKTELTDTEVGVFSRWGKNAVNETLKFKDYWSNNGVNILRSISTRFRKLDKDLGIKMADSLEYVPFKENAHMEEFISELQNVKLPPIIKPKTLKNMQQVLQGKAEPLNPWVKKVADIIRRGSDKVWDKAANEYNFKLELSDGTIVPLKERYMKNYDHRMMDWEMSKEGGEFRNTNIKKIMEKKGLTVEKAAELLDTMIENSSALKGSAKRNGSLHYAREFDLDGYDNNPINSFLKYARQTAKEMAAIDVFGEGQVKATEMIKDIAKKNGIDEAEIQLMYNRAMSQYGPKELQRMKMLKPFKKVENLTHLQLSGVSNIQELAQAFKYRPAKAAWDFLFHYKNSKEFAQQVAAMVRTTESRMSGVNTLEGAFFRGTQFNLTQSWTEIFGANSAKHYVIDMFKKYKENELSVEELKTYSQYMESNKKFFNIPLEKAVEITKIKNKMDNMIITDRALREFKLDPQEMLRESKERLKEGKSDSINYSDLMTASQRGAAFSADMPTQANMPLWATSPNGSAVALWTGWAFARKANMLKVLSTAKENWKSTHSPKAFTPLIKLAVANGITTVASTALRKLIKTGEISYEDDKALNLWLEYTANMTLGPIYSGIMISLAAGERGIYGKMGGPIVQDVVKGASAVGQGAKKVANEVIE